MIVRETCPICDGQPEPIFSCSFNEEALARVLAHVPELKMEIAKEDFVINWCKSCDFYFQALTPSESDLAIIYASHFDEEAIIREISAQKLHWLTHLTEEILVMRQMISSARPKVLDYGSNWGKWASMALAFGCDVYAVEVNPVAAAFCSSRGIKIIDRNDLAHHQFDFINVDQVMEHVSDPLDLAMELTSSLAPDGIMKWSTPHNSSLPGKLRSAQSSHDLSILNPVDLDALEPFIHLNLFTNRSLRQLGRKVGLQVVPLPFFKWLGAGQLWNIPRQIGRNLSSPRKRWLGQGTYLWFSHIEDKNGK